MHEKDEPNQKTDGLLHEAISAPPIPEAKGVSYSDGSANPFSPEARLRRARLIKEINADWSEDSERALSLIANRYMAKQ